MYLCKASPLGATSSCSDHALAFIDGTNTGECLSAFAHAAFFLLSFHPSSRCTCLCWLSPACHSRVCFSPLGDATASNPSDLEVSPMTLFSHTVISVRIRSSTIQLAVLLLALRRMAKWILRTNRCGASLRERLAYPVPPDL
jgi:hypothetical protein